MLDEKINRKVAVCKELTKKNEWVFRGDIKKVIAEINKDKSNLKGEFTLLIQGNKIPKKAMEIIKAIVAKPEVLG